MPTPLPPYVGKTIDMLKLVATAIGIDNELLIVTVLGFKASSDLLRAIAALIASGIFALGRILVNAKGQ